MLSMTMQALPGGQSIKTGRSSETLFCNSLFMIGIPDASPVFIIPVFAVTLPETLSCTLPIGFSCSPIAFSGQSSIQPPQEWHTSSKTYGLFFIKASALNLQIQRICGNRCIGFRYDWYFYRYYFFSGLLRLKKQ
jgi:hypothetical protein